MGDELDLTGRRGDGSGIFPNNEKVVVACSDDGVPFGDGMNPLNATDSVRVSFQVKHGGMGRDVENDNRSIGAYSPDIFNNIYQRENRGASVAQNLDGGALDTIPNAHSIVTAAGPNLIDRIDAEQLVDSASGDRDTEECDVRRGIENDEFVRDGEPHGVLVLNDTGRLRHNGEFRDGLELGGIVDADAASRTGANPNRVGGRGIKGNNPTQAVNAGDFANETGLEGISRRVRGRKRENGNAVFSRSDPNVRVDHANAGNG